MQPPSQSLLLASALLGAAITAGCTSDADKTVDDSSLSQYWCETLDDVNDYYIEDGGGSGASGLIKGRIITSYGDDIHAPQLVGRLDYTLESVSSGGSPQLEKTDDYGEFSATVGEGTWRVQAATTISGNSCGADYQFEVVGSKTTYICVELACD